jgi:SAM-dependent methyltransferase
MSYPNKVNGIFPFFKGINLMYNKEYYYFKLLKKIFEGEYKLENIDRCFCGSTEIEVLSVQDRYGLPFGTKICKKCGLIFLSPRLSAENLQNFYDEIYWGLVLGDNQIPLATAVAGRGSSIFKFMKSNIDFSKYGKSPVLFEIGCGSGDKLDEIKSDAEKDGIKLIISGCDYSKSAVTIAKEKGYNIFEGGIESLFGEEKADLIILSHVVEHFIDLDGEFKKIQKILKPGSYTYIEVPGVCDLINKNEYDYNYLIYSILAHIHNFNLNSLKSVVEKYGFKFVSGNEYVMSIFQYNPDYIGNSDYSKNYDKILDSLKKCENYRLEYLSRKEKSIKRKIRNLLKKALG